MPRFREKGRFIATPSWDIMHSWWAVVPAAGRGTRLAALTRGRPKELLPVGGRPLILHKILSHLAAGIRKIAVVISPEKEVIRSYLTGERREFPFGLSPLDPAELPGAELVFLYQERPLGVADAVSLARKLVGDSCFAAAMPDTLAPEHTAQLAAGFKKAGAEVVGLVRVDEESAGMFGNLGVTDISPDLRPGEVREITGLSPRAEGPLDLRGRGPVMKLFGGGLFLPRYFDLVEEVRARAGEGEVDDLSIMDIIINRYGLHGVVLNGPAYDAGNPGGYAEAVKHWPKEVSKQGGER